MLAILVEFQISVFELTQQALHTHVYIYIYIILHDPPGNKMYIMLNRETCVSCVYYGHWPFAACE